MALGIIKYSANEIMKIDSLENFKNYIKSTFSNFKDISFLQYYTILKKYEFNSEILNMNRRVLEVPIIEYINKININKSNKLIEKLKAIKDDCYEEWSICVYDSESIYKVHDYFVIQTALIFKDQNYSNSNIDNINNNNSNNLEFIKDYFFTHSKYEKNKKIKLYLINYENALIERKKHMCSIDKRKTKLISGIYSVLDKINDLDNNSVYNSTGSGDISIDYKSTEKSLDKSVDNEEIAIGSEKKIMPVALNSQYEVTKRNYKRFKKHTKFLSSVSYSQFVNSHKEEKDFNRFVTKINNKLNMLSGVGGKSFCLKNIDMTNKSNLSNNDISFDI